MASKTFRERANRFVVDESDFKTCDFRETYAHNFVSYLLLVGYQTNGDILEMTKKELDEFWELFYTENQEFD